MTETAPTTADVVPLGPEHRDALVEFSAALPEGDRTFIGEDVADPEVVRGRIGEGTGGRRRITLSGHGVTGDEVTGSVALRRSRGATWSGMDAVALPGVLGERDAPG